VDLTLGLSAFQTHTVRYGSGGGGGGKRQLSIRKSSSHPRSVLGFGNALDIVQRIEDTEGRERQIPRVEALGWITIEAILGDWEE